MKKANSVICIESHNLKNNLESLQDSLSRRTADELFSLDAPAAGALIVVKAVPWGTIGYLAIDAIVNGKCSGGTRMTTDITEDEVINLARAMTLKFAFKNSAIGGAKSGILLPQDADRVLFRGIGRQGQQLRRAGDGN